MKFLHKIRVLRAVGWIAVACGLALLVVVGARSTRHEMLENTTIIERLATNFARAERIDPMTFGVVEQLLKRPDYDCRRIACDAPLAKRNAAARAKLETTLAKHPVPPTIAAAN